MNKIFVLVLIVSASFFFSACIQLQTKININNDGSGTVEETVLMSNAMVQMLNEFITGFSEDSTNVEEFKLYNEEDLKSRVSDMGEGVKFESGSEIKTEDNEGYHAIYSFTDLNKLKIDQNPDSKIPDEMSEAEDTQEKEKEYVTFSFTKGSTSEIKINMPLSSREKKEEDINNGEEENEALEDSSGNADISQMKFLLKDLNISLVVNVNGEITETNAGYQEGSSITLFDMDFGKLLDNTEKLEELKKINPNNLTDLKEILSGIAGIKIETNNPVLIKFR